MKMLPALGKDSSVTENGHFLVRPTKVGNWKGYEVVDTITDEPYTEPDEDNPEVPVAVSWSEKSQAEAKAIDLAQGALDAAPPQ